MSDIAALLRRCRPEDLDRAGSYAYPILVTMPWKLLVWRADGTALEYPIVVAVAEDGFTFEGHLASRPDNPLLGRFPWYRAPMWSDLLGALGVARRDPEYARCASGARWLARLGRYGALATREQVGLVLLWAEMGREER